MGGRHVVARALSRETSGSNLQACSSNSLCVLGLYYIILLVHTDKLLEVGETFAHLPSSFPCWEMETTALKGAAARGRKPGSTTTPSR